MERQKKHYSQPKDPAANSSMILKQDENMTVVHRPVKIPTLSEKIEERRLYMVRDSASEPVRNDNPLPQEEMKLLAMLTGKWKLSGVGHAAPGADGYRIYGTESYDWVPGGHFLSGKWDMLFDVAAYKGVSIMGYNAVKKHLYMTHFDDAGYVRHYKVRVCGNHWSITGNRERISIHFAANGQSFTEKREISTDNTTWKLHCSIDAIKLPTTASLLKNTPAR